VLMDDTEPTYFKITTTLVQPLFTWNKISNAIALAGIDYDISRIAVSKAKEEIKKQVAQIYYGAIMARESTVILGQARDTLAEIVTDRKKSFNEGYINLQKILEAKKNLARMEAALIQSEEAWLSSLAGLAFYAGIDMENCTLASDFAKVLPEVDETALRTAALSGSFDIAITQKKAEQARRYMAIEKAGMPFRPDISFVASFDITGQKIPVVSSNWTDTWNSNLTLTIGTQMKLFDAGKASNKTKAAQTTTELAALGLSQLKKGLELSVRKAVQELKGAYYSVLEKEANLTDAEETYKNARVSFENEMITREEMLGASVLLSSTQLELKTAGYKYQTALIELAYLRGDYQ